MYNADENIAEIMKYLKKIETAIQIDAVFSFGNIKLVKKNRIDDLLCCLEATLPKKYKNYEMIVGQKALQSLSAWFKFNDEIKKVFKLNSNLYSINVSSSMRMMKVFQKTIASDINKLYKENPKEMF